MRCTNVQCKGRTKETDAKVYIECGEHGKGETERKIRGKGPAERG
jgi:hypothetical protein